MKMKNLKTVLFIIIAAGLAAACKHRAAETERTPVAVAVMGEVEAKESIGLSFATGGKVEKVLVRPGDRVAAGQRLVTISKSTAQNAYNSAKASLDRAEDAYTRLKQVHDQGSLAEVKWVEMLTTLEQARAMEQIARKQLEDCALIAPASGVVGECRARAGASLLPGESAVTLLDIHYVTVNFSVPESEVATVKEGDEVHIVVPALDDLRLTGRICERGMNASRVSHSYIVKVELPNPDRRLLPGMVCKVHIHEPDSRGIVIPAKCVQTRLEGQSVWVVRNGQAEQRFVQADEFVANGVLVTHGLQAGDTLITAGMEKLYLNAKVAYTLP